MFDLMSVVDQEYTPAADALWLRQSTIGSWELCPARVMQSDQEGFNDTPSEAMSFGTLVHEMTALDLAHGGTPWTVKQTEDLWDSLLTDEYGRSLYELASEDLIKSSVEEAIGAVALWHRVVEPTLPAGERLIEQRMEAPLGILQSGREVWLHGTGDLIYTDGQPGYDWKTAGRGWNDTKAIAIGQPSAYTYLTWYNHGVYIPSWKYWVYDRQKCEWQLHETVRTPKQVSAWLRHAFGIAKSIDAGATAYVPWQSTFGKFKRGWWCSAKFCGAWSICKGKQIADDVDESEVPWTTW